MINISISTYKYGMYKDTETRSFADRTEVLDYILRGEQYTEQLSIDSDLFGENLSKYTEVFEFEGDVYCFDIDV